MFKHKQLNLPGKVIFITSCIYLVTQLYRLLQILLLSNGHHWQEWLALHANLNEFLFTPWTLFTYMFVHADIGDNVLHIVFNMLWLWWFGDFFLRYHTSRQFLGVYLLGGVFSGLFFLFVYNVFPYFVFDRQYATLVGASGAIYALIVAVALRQPDERIGLNLFVRVVWVKMKWFALFVLVFNMLSLGNGNTGGIVCHVGGALFGLIFGLFEQRGSDITLPFCHLYDRIVALFTVSRRPKMKVSPGGAHHINAEKRRDMDYNARQYADQQQIDAILDKISRHGYDGLTAEEKQLLFDASRRKRKGNE